MPTLVELEPFDICDHCGRRHPGPGFPQFKLCSGCRVAAYCSVECHRKAWSEHEKTCTSLGTTSGLMTAKNLGQVDLEEWSREQQQQYRQGYQEATKAVQFVGLHQNLPKIKLEVEKAYQLMPLFIEEVADRKRVVFTVCYREYLRKILVKTCATVQNAPIVDVHKLEVNGIYLTKFDEEWFRGQILRESNQHYYVDYFDFGNQKYIEKKEAAEYSFRVLDQSLCPSKILPAAIRVQLKNVPSSQQYNHLKRMLTEHIKAFTPLNIYVVAYCEESDCYQVQLVEPADKEDI